MMFDHQIKFSERIKPKPVKNINQKDPKNEKYQNEMKNSIFSNENKENAKNISPKINNETSSKFSSNPSQLKIFLQI